MTSVIQFSLLFFFRGDDFYIHQSQNAYIITDIDRKPLSPTASRLHWMQMASVKPILPIITTSVTTLEEFWQLPYRYKNGGRRPRMRKKSRNSPYFL
jgi:hypothetical protein